MSELLETATKFHYQLCLRLDAMEDKYDSVTESWMKSEKGIKHKQLIALNTRLCGEVALFIQRERSNV
jgi:hypothetical protein